MTYEAIQHVMKYCVEQGTNVQITGPRYAPDYLPQVEWVADFQNLIHAEVCCEELKDAGYEVELNPTMYNKTLDKLNVKHYARIV